MSSSNGLTWRWAVLVRNAGRSKARKHNFHAAKGYSSPEEGRHQEMHAILIVLDDLASEQKFHRNYGPISELYTRGRHFFIHTMCWSQKWKLLSPTAHVNAHWIVAFKLRSWQDLDRLLQELMAIYPYEVLLQLYEEAVNDQPYSFLFINMKKNKGRNDFHTLWRNTSNRRKGRTWRWGASCHK